MCEIKDQREDSRVTVQPEQRFASVLTYMVRASVCRFLCMSGAPRDSVEMSAITGRWPRAAAGLRVVSALVWGPFGCLYV